MSLGDLKEIDGQKERIQRNTLQFVQGQPANNVLLTGARGTGKSSLIRACLNEYAPQGLRLIEVDKADLTDLPDIGRDPGRDPHFRSSTIVVPTRILSPGVSIAGATSFCSFTNVPLVEPRSSTYQLPPRSKMRACCWET